MFLVMYPHHVPHHLQYDGQEGPTPGFCQAPWFTNCQHGRCHAQWANQPILTRPRVVRPCSQSDAGRTLSYKSHTWVSGLRHHNLLLSWQRAAAKLVLDQRFERASKSSCMHEFQAHAVCEHTHADFGRGKTRALPVNAARAVLTRVTTRWTVENSVRRAGESGAANQQMSGDPGPRFKRASWAEVEGAVLQPWWGGCQI
jgi:hypothetical protein